MATTYPTSIDVINDPASTNTLADAGYEHDIQHDFANDAIRALETKLGIDGTPVSSTVDYILHHHAHTGADGSVVVAPTSLTSISVTSSGPSVVPILAKAAVSQTADLIQTQNSAGTPIAGITGPGVLYSDTGLTIYNAGATSLLYVSSLVNEVGLRNNAVLKGYTGEGTGQQFALDASNGSLQLGGTTGNPALRLNAYRSARIIYSQADGKNNANLGGINWQDLTNADSPTFPALARTSMGVLQKTSDGSQALTESFLTMGFPTYDGIVTATKSVAISVVPGAIPTMVAGTVAVTGKMNVSDIMTLSVPPVLPTSAYAPASSISGIDSRLARADHIHLGQVGAKAKFTNTTSGNYNITSTVWTPLDTSSDLVIAAKIGDWVEVQMSALSGNDVPSLYLDTVSIVSGTNQNAWGTVKTGPDGGIQAWFGGGTIYAPIGGGTIKQIVASDIDLAGNVTIRILTKISTAGSKVLYASTNNPFHWWVKNLGQ